MTLTEDEKKIWFDERIKVAKEAKEFLDVHNKYVYELYQRVHNSPLLSIIHQKK